MSRRAVALLAVLGVVLVAAPGRAHEADPRIVTTLVAVEPALPAGVVVQVQAGIATQLVASNPTATVLEVVGGDGRPFLRLSRAGVEADVGSAEFFTTSSPSGAAPPGTDDGPPRWVRISAGDSWGWYDHRLHPERLAAPADEGRAATLADVEVPLRYGDRAVRVRGRVDFRPLLGGFQVTADPAPEGLTVQALPGRLPGLFVSVVAGKDVSIAGRDGEPFLRFTDAGVEVNVRSRTHVEDRAARGEPAGPPSTEPAFELLGPDARSWTWLDARLRYPADLPPAAALEADGPTRLQTWEVPAEVGGRSVQLTGAVSWLPEPSAAAQVRRGADDEPAGRDPLPYALGAVAVVVLGGTALLLRRRRTAD